jgi:hypothetical protein
MAIMTRSASLPALVALCVANIAALPEGPGLSASHPHDVGMAGDAAVLLAENFETGALSDLAKRWDDVSNEIRAAIFTKSCLARWTQPLQDSM